MVPESPSVCFRCKLCKLCFLTMKEVERHLKAANHNNTRSSQNTNSSNKTSTTTTTSTANANNESSSEDKPLNLSSKSAFPPVQPPTRPAAEIDLTLSSEDSESEDGKRRRNRSALNDSAKMKESKPTNQEGPRVVSSRKVSVEGPHLANSVCIKDGGETQEDIADVETDTVSSTSSDPPPPDKIATTRVSNEAETSTQFVQEGDERNSPDTCSKTPDYVSEKEKTDITTNSVEMGKKDESFISADCDDDEVDVEMVDSPESPEEKAEVSSTATQTVAGQSFLQDDSQPEEKSGEKGEESNGNDDCEMSANENDEPVPKSVERSKPSNSNSTPSADSKKMSNRNKRYRCKHCDERFSFPVQVHMHMQKVHPSILSQKERKKPDRRRSVNAPTTHNNNNNDTSPKNSVQTYPLRSLHERAKRRTRSMQSTGDGGSGNSSRRNSQTNNNNEEKKERKSIHKKVIYFTCRHCAKKFPLLNQLKIHLHKVHPEMTKKFQNLNQTVNKSLGKRTYYTPQAQSQRLLISSKRRQTTTSVMLQPRERPLRVSTRSVSRADSEPESGRMSTRRRSSVACKSEKSCGDTSTPTTVSSRRSSRRRDEEVKVENAKVEPVSEMEVEKVIGESVPQGKSIRGKTRSTSSNNNNNNNNTKDFSEEGKPVVSDISDAEEEKPEVKPVQMEEKRENMQVDADNDAVEDDSIYNDSDCRIIDTVETILYALTSKKSQTCPNCDKYCKFAGNFKLHLKACMGLNDNLERTDEGEGSSQRTAEQMNEDLEEEEEEEEEDEEEEEEEEEVEDEEMGEESEFVKPKDEVIQKINSENQEDEQVNEGGDEEEDDDDDSKVPYYDRLEYRTCWVCGFVVSRFHNLSRHLKQRHEISMGTKEVHAKMAKILRLKK